MEGSNKDKMSLCINFVVFICAVAALTLLRIYITAPPDPPKIPTTEQVEEFMGTLDGDYYLNMDLMFSRTHIYGVTLKRPMVMVEPANEEDIQKILKFAQNFPDWPFSIKSGGHSAAAYCLNDNGLVMDLSKSFTGISWGDQDRSTIIIESGAIFWNIYQYMIGTGKAIIGGGCNSVSIGGYMQGGGNNVLTPTRGLAIDNLLEVNIILVNGTKRVVSDQNHPDLFWALRGGGGGNFGVVTSFKMKTFDMPLVVVVCVCWYNEMPIIPSILETFAPKLNDPDADILWMFSFARLSTRIYFCVSGTAENVTAEELTNEMEPFIPSYDILRVYNYSDMYAPPDPIPVNDNDYLYIKSMVVDSDAFDSEMNQILSNALTIMRHVPIFRVSFEPFGRASNNISKSDTAFPHRNKSGIIQLKATWPREYDSILGSAVREAANEFWRQLAPWNRGAYVNYIDPEDENWPENYYGDNYDRLKSIKSEVDPTNFLRFAQSIGAK